MDTQDLYLAAAFLALGAKYVGADKSNPRKMTFKFTSNLVEDDDQPFPFSTVERDWINRILLVNAKRYAEALQSMKSIVHSGNSESNVRPDRW